jgi:hypothetical protein
MSYNTFIGLDSENGKASHAPWRIPSVSPTPQGEGAGEAFCLGEMMNYKRVYDKLIETRGSVKKPVGVYTERHRIVPGCLGGEYVEGNAVYLDAKAHYVAHLLLAKALGGECWRAVFFMSGVHKKTKSRMYEASKKGSSAYHSAGGKMTGKYCVENKKGVFALSKADLAKNGGKGGAIKGKNDFKNGTGLFSEGACSRNGKKGGLALSKQRYKCKKCGMVTTAGGLSRHQISSRHVGKIRITNN